MKRQWKILAALIGVIAFAGLGGGQAVAAETLAFVPHSGKFPVKKVTVKGGGVLFHEDGDVIGCGSTTTGEGEITGPKIAWLKLHFTGCKENFGTEFHTPGAKNEEVITEKLPVELVYTSKEHHEAALDLNNKSGTFATWEYPGFYSGCGMRGPVLSPVSPVNSSVLTHTLTLHVTTSGEEIQTPSRYESEAGTKFSAVPEVNMFCSGFLNGGITNEGKLEISTSAAEGAVEIKA